MSHTAPHQRDTGLHSCETRVRCRAGSQSAGTTSNARPWQQTVPGRQRRRAWDHGHWLCWLGLVCSRCQAPFSSLSHLCRFITRHRTVSQCVPSSPNGSDCKCSSDHETLGVPVNAVTRQHLQDSVPNWGKPSSMVIFFASSCPKSRSHVHIRASRKQVSDRQRKQTEPLQTHKTPGVTPRARPLPHRQPTSPSIHASHPHQGALPPTATAASPATDCPLPPPRD